jgi:hypothetical protein
MPISHLGYQRFGERGVEVIDSRTCELRKAVVLRRVVVAWRHKAHTWC